MTILVSLIFIIAIIFSASVILGTVKSSAPRILDIIEGREVAAAISPNIRIGEVRHYKLALSDDKDLPMYDEVIKRSNIITMPLNLSNPISDVPLSAAA